MLFSLVFSSSYVYATPDPDYLIIINRYKNKLALFNHSQLIRELSILNKKELYLTGKVLVVLKKDKTWLGVNAKGTDGKLFGITSGNQTDSGQSILLSPQDMAWLSEQIPLETPVWITASRDSFYMLYDDAVEMPVPKKESIDKNLTIVENTGLYWQPDLEAATTYQLGPQIIRAYEKWGNWYHIHTFQGDLWIPDCLVLTGKPVPYKKKIKLVQMVPLYNQPVPDQRAETALAPQTVQVEEKYEDWYKVRTDFGSLWIHPSKVNVE